MVLKIIVTWYVLFLYIEYSVFSTFVKNKTPLSTFITFGHNFMDSICPNMQAEYDLIKRRDSNSDDSTDEDEE